MLFSSGLANMALDHLLDFLKDYTPAPPRERKLPARPSTASPMPPRPRARSTMPSPSTAVVFKTMSDPFAGRITFFKVISGVIKNDATLENFTRRSSEKLSHLSIMQGRKAVEVAELHAGDIGAVGKLRDTLTGDTLGVKGADFQIALPDAARARHDLCHRAQVARRRGQARSRHPQADGRGSAHPLLPRPADQRVPHRRRGPAAHRGHRQPPQEALPRRSHAQSAQGSRILKPSAPKAKPTAATKSSPAATASSATAKSAWSHSPRGGGFEFASEIFGGAIPRNFIPAIEKGIVESAARGYLAGYPVVDFKAIVYDGSYHDVDSNELSFKTAGRLAFRKAMEVCKPALLEPIMKVAIEAPDEFAGTLMGDLNSRRGRVQGMDTKGRTTVINAEVPMSEMLAYGTQLTSMTQGKGSYRMEMDHYDFVPQLVADKILANAKRPVEEEEE